MSHLDVPSIKNYAIIHDLLTGDKRKLLSILKEKRKEIARCFIKAPYPIEMNFSPTVKFSYLFCGIEEYDLIITLLKLMLKGLNQDD